MAYQNDIPIKDLVAKIKHGEIRLPEMQRRYVWKITQVCDLLDSLYRGYPSGTILTWETDESVETRQFAIDQDNATRTSSYQLLLDGQQRLTSLSAILRGDLVSVNDRKRPIDILFNLEHPDQLQFNTEVNDGNEAEYDDEDDTSEATKNELLQHSNRQIDARVFVVASKNLATLSHLVSVTKVFKESSDDRPFLKAAGVTSMDDSRYEKYTDRLKQLRAIQDYSYRVHVLGRDNSHEEVTEIFVRVNSLGVKLRSADLALAQITAKWPGSLKVFQSFEEECARKDFPLELAVHLRNLVAFVTKQSKFRAVSGLSRAQLEEGWEASKKGMLYALNFLRSNVKIDSSELLSSPFIIISIAMFGHKRNYKLTPKESKDLRVWALLANAKGRYSSSTETLLDQDLATIRRGDDPSALIQRLETQVGRLGIEVGDLDAKDSRSAYFKTMFLAFHKDGATDWRDQLTISLKHTGSGHKLQFHHIFPQAVLKRTGITEKERINDICNLSFISERTNKKISDKDPSSYLPDIVAKQGPEALSRQCIPTDPQLWLVDRYDDFLSARRELVAKRLNDFIQEG